MGKQDVAYGLPDRGISDRNPPDQTHSFDWMGNSMDYSDPNMKGSGKGMTIHHGGGWGHVEAVGMQPPHESNPYMGHPAQESTSRFAASGEGPQEPSVAIDTDGGRPRCALQVCVPARNGTGFRSFAIRGPKRNSVEHARVDGERMLHAFREGGESEVRRVQRLLQDPSGMNYETAPVANTGIGSCSSAAFSDEFPEAGNGMAQAQPRFMPTAHGDTGQEGCPGVFTEDMCKQHGMEELWPASNADAECFKVKVESITQNTW